MLEQKRELIQKKCFSRKSVHNAKQFLFNSLNRSTSLFI